MNNYFNLSNKIILITGGGGLLAFHHAAAIISYGGTPILLDNNLASLQKNQTNLFREFRRNIFTLECDITDALSLQKSLITIKNEFHGIDVLINNAARNPKVESNQEINFSRLEDFPIDQWNLDISVGLTGAFNCCKVFGTYMARSGKGGHIINIASDLGVIAPDQRIYQVPGLSSHLQPVKPISYSVVKHGLIGMTKYLATYWCDYSVRCNSISPGGVQNGQNQEFVEKLAGLIPMGRMAQPDEYRGAIVFLCSDSSSYLNGANIIIDGGRSAW